MCRRRKAGIDKPGFVDNSDREFGQGGKKITERGEISGEETIFWLTSRSSRDLPFEWTNPRIPI